MFATEKNYAFRFYGSRDKVHELYVSYESTHHHAREVRWKIVSLPDAEHGNVVEPILNFER